MAKLMTDATSFGSWVVSGDSGTGGVAVRSELMDEIIRKAEARMKNKVYEYVIATLDDKGEIKNTYEGTKDPRFIVAKSPEAAKIKASQYADGEYGEHYTILVREFKGE